MVDRRSTVLRIEAVVAARSEPPAGPGFGHELDEHKTKRSTELP